MGMTSEQLEALKNQHVDVAQLLYFGQEFKGKVEDYTDGEVKKVTDSIGTVPTDSTVMGEIAKAQNAATYDDTEVRGLISDNADAIAAHKELVDGVVTTLVGSDADKSVRTIANEELAAQLIPESAKESLDTLEEIAAWIQAHPDDASAMNLEIETLKGTGEGSVSKAIADATANMVETDDIADVVRTADIADVVRTSDISFATKADMDAIIAEIFPTA